MILYSSDTWFGQIFRVRGTVWRVIWWKVLLISGYTLAAYLWCARHGANLGHSKSSILGPILSSLLVFRANNAYARFWQGRTLVTQFFCSLREVVALGVLGMGGGARDHLFRWRYRHSPSIASGGAQAERKKRDIDRHLDACDRIASEERVDLVRWALVVAISLHLHAWTLGELERGELSGHTKWLADWGRFRIRCLTTAREFGELDRHIRSLAVPQALWDDQPMDDLEAVLRDYQEAGGAGGQAAIEVSTDPRVRLPVVALYRLNEVLVRNMSEARRQERPYGLMERFVLVCCGLTQQLVHNVSMMEQIVTCPLPFPWFHLTKVLLFVYFLAFPFFIQYELGCWANLGELCCLAVALLGIDAIATELENPFGDDDSDLDIHQSISALEAELVLLVKVLGDERVESSFVWQDMPEQLTARSLSPIPAFLALRSQVESNGGANDAFYGERARRDRLPARPDPASPTSDDDVSD